MTEFMDEAMSLVDDPLWDQPEVVELIPLSDITLPNVMDNTKLASYAKCPKQFYWAHVQGLQPGTKSIHLHAGAAFASSFEAFRKSYYSPSPTGSEGDFDLALKEGLFALIISYGFDELRDSDPAWTQSAKGWEGMCCAFIHAVHNWHPDHDNLKPVMIDGVPSVEISFQLPTGIINPATGELYVIHGRFDMLGSFGGSVFVEDDKTCSQLGASWSNQWDLRSQFTGYCKGAKSLGMSVAGAIIRGTCILKTKITHAEAIVYRPPYLIDRWDEDVEVILDRINWSFMEGKWPTLGTFNEECQAYGGCDYKQLCNSPDPEVWLPNYHRKFWDPTNPDNS